MDKKFTNADEIIKKRVRRENAEMVKKWNNFDEWMFEFCFYVTCRLPSTVDKNKQAILYDCFDPASRLLPTSETNGKCRKSRKCIR